MRSVEEIVAITEARGKATDADQRRMAALDGFLTGKNMPKVEGMDDEEAAATANLARQHLAQLSLRASSSLPMPYWEAVDVADEASRTRANNRLRANLGWWEKTDMRAVLRMRCFHLFAHGLGPVIVLPNGKTQSPRWQPHHPRMYRGSTEGVEQEEAAFEWHSTIGDIRRIFGRDIADRVRRPKDCKDDYKIKLIEWIDHEQITMVAVGSDTATNVWGGTYNPAHGWAGQTAPVVLQRLPNKAERPLVFVPTLDDGLCGPRGLFDEMPGIHKRREKLFHLLYTTAAKGAAPDTFLQPFNADGDPPELISPPNPATGEPGIIKGGTLRELTPNPGFLSMPFLSTLEREERLEGGVPAELTGEPGSTVRTARLGVQLTDAVIDPRIQHVHERLEYSMAAENKAAVAIAKAYFGGKRSFYINWKGHSGKVDYEPKVDFETDENYVAFPLAGSDANNDMIRTERKRATGLISNQTARERDPEIRDAGMEERRVTAERLKSAWLASIETKVADPNSRWSPLHVQRLIKAVEAGRDEYEVIEEIEAEMQEQMEAPPDAVPGAGGAPLPPEAMAQPPSMSGIAAVLGELRQRAA